MSTMNNDDLKRFMKQEINFEIKDCLGEIKEKASEIEVEPCLTETKQARHARKYAFYTLIGGILLGTCVFQAYRYVTPSTFITIEVGSSKDDLNVVSPYMLTDDETTYAEGSFFIKVNLNDFDHVIDISTTNENLENIKMSHMNYQDAFKIIVEKIFDYTNKQQSLTFSIFSDDYEKYDDIEKFLDAAVFNENYKQIHIDKFNINFDKDISYGKQCAIKRILEKTDDYTEAELQKKTLQALVDILIKL